MTDEKYVLSQKILDMSKIKSLLAPEHLFILFLF